jgi:N-acetylglucosaminyl-diphospho-decaprenol L-rhamnosyltransferase
LTATVVVPTAAGAERLPRLLRSLERQTVSHQTIVVDNGSTDGTAALLAGLPDVEVIRLGENVGFTRAVNLAAARADGDALLMLNDDCVVEPDYVERLTAALDPAGGVVMAAGVLCDARHPGVIDTAGMELDETLLVFDYLNGYSVAALATASDPIGPSGAAAAFDRDAFRAVGGFDEALFAYWEDVDLVLRLRRGGARCALARTARGIHEHSATLGSGSRQKNYLVGFGRGYLLRKWSVASARTVAQVLIQDGVICAGQALVDRTLSGVRGRLDGWRAAASAEQQPPPDDLLLDGYVVGFASTLRRRAARRFRLRRDGPPT